MLCFYIHVCCLLFFDTVCFLQVWIFALIGPPGPKMKFLEGGSVINSWAQMGHQYASAFSGWSAFRTVADKMKKYRGSKLQTGLGSKVRAKVL